MKNLYFRFFKNHKLSSVLILFLSLSVPIISNLIPQLSQRLIDTLTIHDSTYVIIQISLSVVVLYVIKYLFNALTQISLTHISLDAITTIKKEIISEIIKSPLEFHDQSTSQYILNRINETNNISKLYSSEILSFLVNTLTAVISFVMVLNINMLIAFCAIIFIPILYLVSKYAYRKMDNQIKTLLENSAKTNETIYSKINGVVAIKQFNNESQFINSINSQIEKLEHQILLKNLTVSKTSNSVLCIIYVIQTALMCGIAILINKDFLTVGTYISLSQYLSLIYAPILSLQAVILNIKPAIIAFNRLIELRKSTDKTTGCISCKGISNVNVANLSFGYSCNKSILKNISFNIRKGDKLMIKGDNGTGKTTLTKLLSGLYSTYSGDIYINDKELRSYSETSLRNNISIAPQKPYLFDLTVYDNIRIANPQLSNSEFDKFLQYFENLELLKGIDLDHVIKDNGKDLSGGQIQRISLARTLIRNTDLCIFDECMVSLDIYSKKIMKKIFAEEFNDKICIFISHDTDLEELCNKFLYLEGDDHQYART